MTMCICEKNNKMKASITITLISISIACFAQTKAQKLVPIKPGQELNLQFDYPNLIQVTTWDKNEILIEGEVNINFGLNDDAFELETSQQGNTVVVRNYIRNIKKLPQHITVYNGEQKIIFESQSDYRKFIKDNEGGFDVVKWGVDMEIILSVKVPKNIRTTIESTYGMVEVQNFNSPISVSAKYGGVDAALDELEVGELVAETSFGQIYSNLDAKFNSNESRDEDFHMLVSSRPGTGPRYVLASKFGNVYLRKQK